MRHDLQIILLEMPVSYNLSILKKVFNTVTATDIESFCDQGSFFANIDSRKTIANKNMKIGSNIEKSLINEPIFLKQKIIRL